ncbi:MAG: phosphodiesterase [Mesorhizobium sp.]|uniref:phosphodiesterase n=1 Tax=Mesorhizobium sp. TaxID=1871066 RepID=UPI000FE37792|nr:phosphodiesterase [Mesorhizobium sp.]RWA71679.1 MAG: phosphodiesterase [Mesorhizobium sp.]RWC00975.1 MAG: phosphodiesterase [Mesorhizobium sp.]RWK21556.1 MAG: phosphodiesterase [Mesorhizobium sp.]RWK31540.1 MAG: phosphodiesterase [Mesorhizobium sp.]TIQ42820.1 MAG: phosphodiesterase [Mesorhizobium sp.]
MKIIQVTDVHLGRRGEVRFGADLHERLDRCIDHINQRHSDATLCVFTGDLTDDGEAESYADLKVALSRLAVPCRLLPGNHDRRANLVAAFPENGTDDNGFVQSAFETPEGRLVFLDSLAQGRVTGELCDKRLAWLDARLAEAAGKPAYLFLHHPPLELGLTILDPLGLEQPQRLLDVLTRRGNVRYIFFGHVHRDIAGTVAGIPFSAQRGLHARFILDLVGDEVVEQAPPAYSIILIDGQRVVVRSHDFLESWPLWSPATGERVR